MFLPLLLAFGVSLASSAWTSTTQWTTSSPHWMDPFGDGHYGNPGARICLSNKTLDQVHSFAAYQIAYIYKNVSVPDFSVTVGSTMLTVKSPRITKVEFPNFAAEYLNPTKIHSDFFNGRIEAEGLWSNRHIYQRNIAPLNGTYRVTVKNAQLNVTTQLARNSDGKPGAQMVSCDAWFGDFKVDVQGYPDIDTINDPDSKDAPLTNKARAHFEDFMCSTVRTFIRDIINTQLATFPNRVLIPNRALILARDQNKVELDYDLMYNQPKFNHGYLQADLEGKAVWRGNDYVPFSPSDLDFSATDHAMSFQLSDYVFNTMLYQAHSQGFKFSAAELLADTTGIAEKLRLNCSSSLVQSRSNVQRKKTKPMQRKTPVGRALDLDTQWKCLGSVFANTTTSIGQFSWNASGDLMLKNQKAPSIYIQSADNAFFDASNAILEVYGPLKGDQRQLLAKSDIRVLRGQFVPKFENGNFTGSIKITEFELKQGAIGMAAQTRSMDDDWMERLQQFSKPLLTEMLNTFMKKFFQFPVPMLDGYQCQSPKLIVSARSMQVDCDVQLTQARKQTFYCCYTTDSYIYCYVCDPDQN